MKVNDLILPSGVWNEGLIREVFLAVDVDIICSLPCSNTGVEDKLIWDYDRFGQYITGSGYHVVGVVGRVHRLIIIGSQYLEVKYSK